MAQTKKLGGVEYANQEDWNSNRADRAYLIYLSRKFPAFDVPKDFERVQKKHPNNQWVKMMREHNIKNPFTVAEIDIVKKMTQELLAEHGVVYKGKLNNWKELKIALRQIPLKNVPESAAGVSDPRSALHSILKHLNMGLLQASTSERKGTPSDVILLALKIHVKEAQRLARHALAQPPVESTEDCTRAECTQVAIIECTSCGAGYCSELCAELDWETGGHFRVCE
jgi:hypothetical protein